MDAVGPALARAKRGLLGVRLDLVEALEELQGLIWQAAVAPARLLRFDEAAAGMGHAAQMGCPLQAAPCGIAIGHQ